MLFIRESWLLIVASLCFGVLLAGINYVLQPKIDSNSTTKQNEALKELLVNAQDFEIIVKDEAIENIEAPVTIYKGLNGQQCEGWAFNATGPGYADRIDILIAVDAKFEKIIGYSVLFSNETVGFGDKIKNEYFRNQFAGAPVSELELLKMGDDKIIDHEIIAISGATVSSNAEVEIFNKYLPAIKEFLMQKGLIQ